MSSQMLKSIPLEGSKTPNRPRVSHRTVLEVEVPSRPPLVLSPISAETENVNPASIAALDNTLPKLHYVEQGDDWKKRSKALKWSALRLQRRYAPNKGMKLCGLVPIETKEQFRVSIVKDKGKPAKYANRMLCKSFWCPHCSDVFREEKREALRTGLNHSIETGKFIYFVTFTIPKSFGTIEEKFKGISGVITKLWNRLRNKSKRDGFKLWTVKGLDLTVNDENVNPFHLHSHSVIITDKEVPNLEKWVWCRYETLMSKIKCNVKEAGFDFQRVNTNKQLDGYLVKNWSSLAQELTTTDKEGHYQGSLGWLKWLTKIAVNPTDKQVQLYRSFLTAAKRKRTFDLSRNFNELLKGVNDLNNDDDYEGGLDNNILSLEIGRSLWKALTITRSEDKLLSIVDDFYDKGTRDKEFLFIVNLIETSIGDGNEYQDKINLFIETLRHLGYSKPDKLRC